MVVSSSTSLAGAEIKYFLKQGIFLLERTEIVF